MECANASIDEQDNPGNGIFYLILEFVESMPESLTHDFLYAIH